MPSDGIVDLAPVVDRLMARYYGPEDATTMRAREESRALAHLTDAQALATWERMKAVRRAYVEAIIEKVPQ